MNTPFPKDVTLDSAFVWLLHRIAAEFADHAILKGGMSLKLLDCPRNTNDLDYVFVPYSSKREISGGLDKILAEIPNARITKSMSSKSLKFLIEVSDILLQIEANVSMECKAIAMTTSAMARLVNQPAQVIRIMSLDVALSNKLAAWNERRLLRDLYDVYYIYQIVGEKPDRATLLHRLNKIEARIPALKKKKRMTLDEFIEEIEKGAGEISDVSLRAELSPLLGNSELAGLDKKLKAALNKLVEFLKGE